MTCMCGSTDCPSCGTAQGTYRGPPYDLHVIVPIGIDGVGREVALEVTLTTYGDRDSRRLTTHLEPHLGPWTRLTVNCMFKPPAPGGQFHGWIRETITRWRERWVTWEWLEAMLCLWERYNLNDVKPGTEAQLAAVRSLGHFKPNPSLDEIREHLRVCTVEDDRGHHWGDTDQNGHMLLRPLDKDTADEIIDLVNEGANRARKARQGD